MVSWSVDFIGVSDYSLDVRWRKQIPVHQPL